MGLYEKMQENDLELDTLSNGIKILLYSMIGWLGLITIASVVVFVIVNIRLNQANRALDELEVGSESTVTSKRSRVVDIFNRTEPPTFYNSDREPSSTQDGDVIKVRATDDESECVNGGPTTNHSGPTPESSTSSTSSSSSGISSDACQSTVTPSQ
jgi:hypothetical protein